MYTRQRIQKKTRSQSSSSATEADLFRQRPFTNEANATPAQLQNQETIDLQTQLDRAARFGHNFGRVQVQDSTPAVVQPKLAIGAPGDKYEQEADSVAAQVMSMNTAASQQSIQRQGTEPEEEEVQMKPLASMITPLVQRQEAPEEEELQAKPLVQRQEAAPEEEELQAKPLVQRQEAPEEEELQAKPLVQRQEAAPEEEELQAKPLVQRQEAPDEEELQAKPLVQRQEAAPEEELQAKPLVQRQEAPDEEELQAKPLVQRQEAAPEEELQAKPLVQRQEAPDEEELQAKPLVQRQEAAPEEELQAKPLLQRQEAPAEEELQTKPLLQRQEAPAEEEELQMKTLVQRQEAPAEEEELQMKTLVQRQEAPAEEEELQMKPLVQRQEAPAEEEELQMKRSPQGSEASSHNASDNLENQLTNSKGGGSPLPDDVRSFMEPRFGADFSQVRVHTDSQAIQMNQAVGAQAFTHGSHIYFGAGKSPGISDLTAHELTHVVQQTGTGVHVQRKIDPYQTALVPTEPPNIVTIDTALQALLKNIKEGPSKEEKLRAPLAGKSGDEIDAIKKAYKDKTGEDLDSAIATATINIETINSTVGTLYELIQAGGKADEFKTPLSGKSKDEIQAIKEKYKADHGKALDDAIKDATIDPEKINADADALFKAIDGWGTDEDTILKTLAGKSPMQIKAIKAAYADHYKGRNLDADLESELNKDDWQEAQTHLSGDKVKGAIAALSNSLGTFNDDEKKIHETLKSLSKDELEELRKQADQDPKVKEQINKVFAELDGGDKAAAVNLYEGNKEAASAILLHEARTAGFLWTTDEEAFNKELEGKSPEEIRKIKEEFRNRSEGGWSFEAVVNDEFSGADYDLAMANASGEKGAAAAAKLKAGLDGGIVTDADAEAINAQLKGKDKDEREEIIAAWEKLYGNGKKGSFDEMLKAKLEGDELKMAEQYSKNGELDPVFALTIAMGGQSLEESKKHGGVYNWLEANLGTDEELIKEALKGKTREEINKIEKAYYEATGKVLGVVLKEEMDGRDHFEVDQMMKGKPETEKDYLDRAKDRYEFERGEGSNKASRFFMNTAEKLGVHSKGEMLDHQTKRLEDMFDKDGKLKPAYTKSEVNAEVNAEVKKVAGYQETDAANYKEAKDTVGKTINATAQLIIAALATVATKGGASPWLVAIVSGLTSGATTIATTYVMQGSAVDEEAMAMEALTAAITTALTAGMADGGTFMKHLDDVAKALGEGVAKKVAIEAIKGGIEGASSEALKGIMNDKNWRKGVADYLAGIATEAGKGGLKGVASAVGTNTVKAPLEDKNMSSILVEGVGGLAGAAIDETESAIKGESKGRLEDMLGRIAIQGGYAAAKEIAETGATQAKFNWIAKRAVTAMDANNTLTADQYLDANYLYLEDKEKVEVKSMMVTEIIKTSTSSPQSQSSQTAN